MHSSQLAIYLMVMRCHLPHGPAFLSCFCLQPHLSPSHLPPCETGGTGGLRVTWDLLGRNRFCGREGRSLPVHRGWRGAQGVIHQPHVALVQLQCQWVVVSLVKKDAVVLVSGHLGRAIRVCGLGLTQAPTSPDPLLAASSGDCLGA